MYILHAASELAPIAKIGGLADVVLGLTRELIRKGHDAEVIIPKYDSMDTAQIKDLHIEYRELWSYFDGRWHPNTIWGGWVEGVKVYFVESNCEKQFFERDRLYGEPDDTERFLYFSRAVLEFLLKSQRHPELLHLHDWQTAACAPLLRDIYRDLGLDRTRTVFTIHNIEYQGWTGVEVLGKTGLHGPTYLTPSRLQDNHHGETINLMKGGIVYADWVTTVSPNYAREVKTPEGGRGLEDTLNEYDFKFSGVLNGLDFDYWNPETDRFLSAHYSWHQTPKSPEQPSFKNKRLNQQILRERLMLDDSQGPLVATITRLVPQKGIQLIKYTLFRTLEMGGQFVLLGSSPIPAIDEEFHNLKQRFAKNANVHFELHHNEELAHLIYAGADLFIVPSIFEPCGLTQIIAMRYGSVPIVRKTGGLADTVFDVDYAEVPIRERNGFVFEHPDCEGVDSALVRAFDYHEHKAKEWQDLVLRGMKMDHSWSSSTDKYLSIYKRITEKGRAGA